MTDRRSLVRRGIAVLALGIRTEPAPFAVGFAGAALHAFMIVGSSVVLGRVTDRVILPLIDAGVVDATLLAVAAAAIVGVSVLKAAGIVARRLGAYVMQYRLQATFRRRVTGQYLRLPLAWHRRHSTGALLSNANADVEAAFFTVAPLPMTLGVVIMLVVTAALLIVTDLFLAAVGFVVMPLLAWVNWYYHRRMEVVATEAQQLRADVSALAHESVDGALVVKTLGRERAETERFRVRSEDLRDRMTRLGRLRAAFDPLVEGLPNLGTLLVLLVGAWRVDAGMLTPGELIQFAYLFGLVTLPMRVFGWMLGEMPRSVVGWERVARVLAASSDLAYGDERAGGDGGAEVALDAVEFRYADRIDDSEPDDAEGIRGLLGASFDVPAGRTIAVVGPTGAGKSTVAALLVRLFDPHAGEVLFDGRDLRSLARSELAEQVAVVFQDSFLFDDTVRGNIALGAPFSDQEVRTAARLAQADEFVDALSDGFDSVVGERGATLSGGQRQRIALARALVRRPRLLVLDDATSNVDPAVEARILQALKRAELPSTVVVIAYRRATIALADEVVFVKDGRVIARGSHEDLLERVPAYAHLLSAYDTPARSPSALLDQPLGGEVA